MSHNSVNEGSGARLSSERRGRRSKFDELRATPIWRLPAEIILNICEHIDFIYFPSFLIATYHLLRFHEIIPRYPSTVLKNTLLREETRITNAASLAAMPKELLLAIGEKLATPEKATLVLATYRIDPEDIEILTRGR
ncbi:MAG: hypothetical protein Q9219_000620 [cf. Caloplaca sp. 3 TL-2023]